MSYESKYLKYKNKYLALKVEIEKMQKEDENSTLNNFFSGNFFGGGKQKLQAEPETTLTSLSTTEVSSTQSIEKLFRQLGGAKKKSKKSSKSKSKSKAKAKSSNNMEDDSDITDDSDSSDSSSNSDSDFSSSDLDW
jgi:hypothetical protein